MVKVKEVNGKIVYADQRSHLLSTEEMMKRYPNTKVD